MLNIINIIINIDSRLNKLRVEIIYLPVPCDGNFTILFGQTGDKFDRFTFLDRLKRKILMIVVTINGLKVEHMGEEYILITADFKPDIILGFSPSSIISVTSTTWDVASPFSLRATNLYTPLSEADTCSISNLTANSP